MRVIAFLQLFNELENGNLVRCLDNCKIWADDIYIYDDCSTDGSQEVYLQYTDKTKIIYGNTREFNKEIYHKKELLALALQDNPDWIIWQDGDAILSRELTNNLKNILQELDDKNIDGAYIHYLNLWRSNSFHRVDNSYDKGWFCIVWKNNGKLKYFPKDGLHQDQFPKGMNNTIKINHNVIHYGFSTKENIVRKYVTYKSYGQTGQSLHRLIDETTSFKLLKVNIDVFPEDNIPTNYETEKIPCPIVFQV